MLRDPPQDTGAAAVSVPCSAPSVGGVPPALRHLGVGSPAQAAPVPSFHSWRRRKRVSSGPTVLSKGLLEMRPPLPFFPFGSFSSSPRQGLWRLDRVCFSYAESQVPEQPSEVPTGPRPDPAAPALHALVAHRVTPILKVTKLRLTMWDPARGPLTVTYRRPFACLAPSSVKKRKVLFYGCMV